MNPGENLTFYSYRPAAWLRISGADAATYLQGQFTNDIRQAGQGKAVYGLWLNQKGKVLADSFLATGNAADEFFIASYFSPAAVIRERLDAYVIADEVIIEDLTRDVAGISLLGAGSRIDGATPPAGAISFGGRRSRETNLEWIFPDVRRAEISSQLSSLNWKELSASEMECRRIAGGVPAVPQDIGPTELPNEGGLEMGAISYTKGCYLGQEVMARLKAMGQVRRQLFQVQAKGELIPALPAAIFGGERKIGELRSAAPDGAGNFVGLALLSLVHLQPGMALSLSPAGPAALRILETR